MRTLPSAGAPWKEENKESPVIEDMLSAGGFFWNCKLALPTRGMIFYISLLRLNYGCGVLANCTYSPI
jgi:hypothetical protein